MTVLAVRGEVLRALQADPAALEKALACRNVEELQEFFVDFGRAKGFRVKAVPVMEVPT